LQYRWTESARDGARCQHLDGARRRTLSDTSKVIARGCRGRYVGDRRRVFGRGSYASRPGRAESYLRAASGMVRRRANASKPQIQCNACRCDCRVAARDEQHLFIRRVRLL